MVVQIVEKLALGWVTIYVFIFVKKASNPQSLQSKLETLSRKIKTVPKKDLQHQALWSQGEFPWCKPGAVAPSCLEQNNIHTTEFVFRREEERARTQKKEQRS